MDIKKLIPHSGKHSIQNVVLAIEWDLLEKDTLEVLRVAVKPLTQEKYPRETANKTVSLNINHNPQLAFQTANSTINGYSYSRYSKTGVVEAQIQITMSNLIFIVSDYSRWKNLLEDFQSITDVILPRVSTITKVKDLSLQYADKFKWIGNKEDLDLSEIFDTNSPYVPKHIFSCKSLWHSHHGYIEEMLTPINGQRLDNVNINVTNEAGELTFVILTAHRLKINSSIDSSLLDITNTFNALHLANKNIFKDLLTSSVLESVGIKSK